MREILFRGKREDNGEWIYGSYLEVENRKTKEKTCAIFEYYDDENDSEVLPDTVGQYIGLTDKNGKKIFDGDILESHYDSLYPDNSAIEKVMWYGCGWCIQQDDYEPDLLTEDDNLPYSEVIGNIHDNPELLKGD